MTAETSGRKDGRSTPPEPPRLPGGRVRVATGARAPVFGVFMELYRAARAANRPDRRPRQA